MYFRDVEELLTIGVSGDWRNQTQKHPVNFPVAVNFWGKRCYRKTSSTAENWHHPCIASRPVFIEANALRTFVFYPCEGIPVPDALKLVYVDMSVPLLT
jgi:hypothetical protein